jgi:hypothetical protein
MLKVINIYQILIWLISTIMFGEGLVVSLGNEKNYVAAFMKLLIVTFSVYFIYTNICLLFEFKKERFPNFLRLNKWVNFLQIFHLSLVGFNYYIAVGVHILLYYSYNEIQIISIGFVPYVSSIQINYQRSTAILAGLNLIPLLIFILVNRIMKSQNTKLKKAETMIN